MELAFKFDSFLWPEFEFRVIGYNPGPYGRFSYLHLTRPGLLTCYIFHCFDGFLSKEQDACSVITVQVDDFGVQNYTRQS